MTGPSHMPAPSDLADEMLAAVARAEQAEAELGLARDDLKFARAVRDTALRERDRYAAKLDAVRDLHRTWGESTREHHLTLWKDFDRVLNRVEYTAIPLAARCVLDEVYDTEGVEIFWNAPNNILGARPRDCDLADVVAYANRLADGNF